MPAVPAYTIPDGGVTVPGNGAGSDFSNLLRGIFDGSNNGAGAHPENGLETRIIQRFDDIGALNAAYPPATTTIDKAPYLAAVYAPGDDFAVGYRLDPVAQRWTPTAGFAGLDEGDFDTGGYAPIGTGETRGLMALTVPTSGIGQTLVTVSASARINFNSEDDEVEVILRVKNTSGPGTPAEVRRVTVPAPKSLHNSAVLPTYSFFVDPNDGFTVQVVYTRTAGPSGTCSANSETRYTNLQYFAQGL